MTLWSYAELTNDNTRGVFEACIAVADRIHTMLAVSTGQITAGIYIYYTVASHNLAYNVYV